MCGYAGRVDRVLVQVTSASDDEAAVLELPASNGSQLESARP